VDNLMASPVLLEYFRRKALDRPVVVSPDAGGVERARNFAKRLDASLAIIDKRVNADHRGCRGASGDHPHDMTTRPGPRAGERRARQGPHVRGGLMRSSRKRNAGSPLRKS
jgi:phosphoribosylpyrophosphate synthetase